MSVLIKISQTFTQTFPYTVCFASMVKYLSVPDNIKLFLPNTVACVENV